MTFKLFVNDKETTVKQLLETLTKNLGTLLVNEYMDDNYTDSGALIVDLINLEQACSWNKGPLVRLDVVGTKKGSAHKSYSFDCIFTTPNNKEEDLSQGVIANSDIQPTDRAPAFVAEHTGGSVSYYKVQIERPLAGTPAYQAECMDVALALNMTIEEFNIFKAIWRTAAERTLGLAKEGNNAKYDAEKIKFFADLQMRRYE